MTHSVEKIINQIFGDTYVPFSIQKDNLAASFH